jgi:hypothetical protein
MTITASDLNILINSPDYVPLAAGDNLIFVTEEDEVILVSRVGSGNPYPSKKRSWLSNVRRENWTLKR